MSLFKIPVWERYIETSHIRSTVVCLHIDAVGVFIYCGADTPSLTTDFIRRHLVGKRSFYAFIEAPSIGNAISQFYKDWEGAQIGGETDEAKALWINTEKSIIQLPACIKRFKNKNDEFTCGMPIHDIKDHPDRDDYHFNNNGEDGMCVLEGFDAPEDCPVERYYDKLREYGEEFKVSVVVDREKTDPKPRRMRCDA